MTGATRVVLVSPTDDRRAVATDLAPRARQLDGLRVGLLDNRKGNAGVLLERVADNLAPAGVVVAARVEKRIFSRPATPDQIRQLAQQSEAVVLAIGD